MPFPSTISTFNIVNPTDRLNSPSHSALHNSVSSVLTQVQTVIGVEGANSVVGTLEYLLKSPASDGGGHVQSANKGGTGQTSFTKGDLLVATSNSVISKLAIGADGTVLTANSSVAAGVNWIPKGIIAQSGSIATFGVSTVVESSVISVTVPGGTLSTNHAVRTTIYVTALTAGDPASSVLVSANYGGNRVASVLLSGTNDAQIADTNPPPATGRIEYTLLANAATNAQQGIMLVDMARPKFAYTPSTSIVSVYAQPIGSVVVDSTQNQTLGLTVRFSRSDLGGGSGIKISGYLVEGIT